MWEASRDDLLGQLLVLRQGAFHQSDGFTQRHTVAFQDAIDIPIERHQLLLVAAQTLQSLRVHLHRLIHSFGHF